MIILSGCKSVRNKNRYQWKKVNSVFFEELKSKSVGKISVFLNLEDGLFGVSLLYLLATTALSPAKRRVESMKTLFQHEILTQQQIHDSMISVRR